MNLFKEIKSLQLYSVVHFIKGTSLSRILLKGLGIVSFFSLSMNNGCNDKGTITAPTLTEVESLGLEGKIVNKMVYVAPYLYVSAASEGLWRRDVSIMTPWEYLGLADTSLGHYINVGVMDFDVKGEDILVAYNGSAPHIKPENSVGIWRSTDAGKQWFRSDRGVPETLTDTYEFNTINVVRRSPHKPEIAVAIAGSAIYRSTDYGDTWTMISGNRGVIINEDYLRWHPYREGEAWRYGITAVFEAYCGSSQDYFTRGKVGVNLIAHGLASGTEINDIAFNSGNPDIVYVSTSSLEGGVMKSTDGGFSWQLDSFNVPEKRYIFRMVEHPTKINTLFMIGGEYVYSTIDGGAHITVLSIFNDDFISSLAFDAVNEKLFIAVKMKGICGISTRTVE
jgi:hypothetical protein